MRDDAWDTVEDAVDAAPHPDGDPAPPRRLSDSLDGCSAASDARPSIGRHPARFVDDWSDGGVTGCVHSASSMGVLVVAVSEPAWASHVRWLASELVARAADVLGPGVVTSVEARVRPR